MAEAEALPFSSIILSQSTRDGGVGVARCVIDVDQTVCDVGNTVLVTWEIQSCPLNERDFIGMFEVEECASPDPSRVKEDCTSKPGCHVTMDRLLDSRLRGDTSISSGLINWTLRKDFFQTRTTSYVRFCYYDHQNNLLASSPIITIQNSSSHPTDPPSALQRAISQISSPVLTKITGVTCDGLRRKAYGLPDPFLKFHLGCGRGKSYLSYHQGQKQVSSVQYETTGPTWPGEVFVFEGLPSDVLEIEVRHKWSTSRPTTSHFLGKVLLPYTTFLGIQGQRTFELQKRLPSDRVSGTISFNVMHDGLHLEGGAAVTIAPRQHLLLPELFRQTSLKDECQFSSDEDYSPLITLHCINEGDVGVAGENDTKPVVMVTNCLGSKFRKVAGGGIGAASPATPTPGTDDDESGFHGSIGYDPALPSIQRQLSAPVQIRLVRQVLYGSMQHLGKGLSRCNSLMSQPERSVASSRTSLLNHTPSPLTLSPLTPSPSPLAVHGAFPGVERIGDMSLPPNWEVRRGAGGKPLYYDHINKVVSLDRPSPGTGGGTALPPGIEGGLSSQASIQQFLARSLTNSLHRQPSQPLPDIADTEGEELNTGKQWSLSHSFSEGGLSQDKRLAVRLIQERGGGGEMRNTGAETSTQEHPLQETKLAVEVASLPSGEGEESRESLRVNKEAEILAESVGSRDNGREEAEGEDGQIVDREGEKDEGQVLHGKDREGEREDVRKKDEGEEKQGAKNEVMHLKHKESVSEDIRRSPGFKFLTRPDLYKFVQEQGYAEFFSNLPVLKLIQTIRSDHSLYPRYQHSSKLVQVINSFAWTDCKLPGSWEKKVDPKTSKVVFIDHTAHYTSYIDPRLPYPGNDLLLDSSDKMSGVTSRNRPYVLDDDLSHTHRRPRLLSHFSRTTETSERSSRRVSQGDTYSGPPPPLPPVAPDNTECSYSKRVVQFLRQADIFSQLEERSGNVVDNALREVITRIQDEGETTLDAFNQSDEDLGLQLTLLLSLFDEEINHFTFPVPTETADLPPGPSVDIQPLQLPQVNLTTNTFEGLTGEHICCYFSEQACYRQVVQELNFLSAEHREFIVTSSESTGDGVIARLVNESSYREFIFSMVHRIKEFNNILNSPEVLPEEAMSEDPVEVSTGIPASSTCRDPVEVSTGIPASSTRRDPVEVSTGIPASSTRRDPVEVSTGIPASSTRRDPVEVSTGIPASSTRRDPVEVSTGIPASSTRRDPVEVSTGVPASSTRRDPVEVSTGVPASSTRRDPVEVSTGVPPSSTRRDLVDESTGIPASSTRRDPVEVSTGIPASSTRRDPVEESTGIPASSTRRDPVEESTGIPASSTHRDPVEVSTGIPPSSTRRDPVEVSTGIPPSFTCRDPVEVSTGIPASSTCRDPVEVSTGVPPSSTRRDPVEESTGIPASSTRRDPVEVSTGVPASSTRLPPPLPHTPSSSTSAPSSSCRSSQEGSEPCCLLPSPSCSPPPPPPSPPPLPYNAPFVWETTGAALVNSQDHTIAGFPSALVRSYLEVELLPPLLFPTVTELEQTLCLDEVLASLIMYVMDDLRAFCMHNSSSSPSPNAPLHVPGPTKPSSKASKFVDKLYHFQCILNTNGYANNFNSPHQILVKRGKLLESAFRNIMSTSAKLLRTSTCNVSFENENGLDYGGPQREFFFLVSRQLFNPYYGLFEYSQGSYTIQICQDALEIDDALLWYRFAGRMIGYAIIQGHLLDVFFARHVYKALLGRAYMVSDVEAIDVAFFNSLQYVLDNDPEPLDLNFSVLEETFGDLSEYELEPGGSTLAVTEDNKARYVDLMVAWRLFRGIKSQSDALRLGLHEMLPAEDLDQFDSQELEWVIAGTPEINMEDWRSNTEYWGVYSATHKVIVWFWEVVDTFSSELKLRLLQFVTGTSSVPFEGFRALRGSNKLEAFTIDSADEDMLPSSYTCFNRLNLPQYSSKSLLFQKLTLAIEECTSFENA